MSTPGWRVGENVSLHERNTFHVEAKARWLLEIDDSDRLEEALSQPEWRDLPLLPIGMGSNILFAGDFDGVALTFNARKVEPVNEDGIDAVVRVQAGMPWHDFVMWSLDNGHCGLENLSLIPGTVGAAPMQNIGAYGTEVGDYIEMVEVFDLSRRRFEGIGHDDCGFAYRDSLFKREPGRYLITAVEFRLPHLAPPKTNYAGIEEELAAMGITAPTPRDVAEAVIRVRTRKLPDPAVLGNAGSFFKNPIVPVAQAEALALEHPLLPVFRGGSDDARKLSAAWLIDQCGWKGFRDGDAGVSAAHALVLVNHGDATGAQLLALARRIVASVHEKFVVALEPEPKLVGAAW